MMGDAEFLKARKARRKLTQPLENTVFMILVGLLTLLALGLLGSVWNGHVSMFGLGWFILGGYLVVTAGQNVAQSYFVSTAVTDQIPIVSNAIITVLDGIFPALLIACGLLTLARMMRVGAQMNDDLAGTV